MSAIDNLLGVYQNLMDERMESVEAPANSFKAKLRYGLGFAIGRIESELEGMPLTPEQQTAFNRTMKIWPRGDYESHGENTEDDKGNRDVERPVTARR